MTATPMTLDYHTPQPRKRRRMWFGFVLFIALALLLFSLLKTQTPPANWISVSEFESRLDVDQVKQVTITGDELNGSFNRPLLITSAGSTPITQFRVALPSGIGGSAQFVMWVLDHRHNAEVVADNNSNLVANILVPLIPWLLIFFFIWFFVFRTLKRRQPMPVYIVNPPGEAPQVK
jgi:ATP-dependent Zn protease